MHLIALDVIEDIKLDIHESPLLQLQLIVMLDIGWEPGIDMGEDLEEHIVLKARTHNFNCSMYNIVVPVNSLSDSGHVVENLGSVSVIK